MVLRVPRPDVGHRGPPLEPGLGVGLGGERLVAGPIPMGPGRAQPETMTWDPLPAGSPPAGGAKGVGGNASWAGGRRRGPWQSNPRLQKLALGTWKVTSLVGKEPELVREVEKFRLDIVGLTLTHSKGSGTSLLERGWTFFHSGVVTGERRRAGVAILTAPPAWCLYVGVYPGRREGSLPPPSGGGTDPDCCLCLWSKQQFRVSTLFGLLGGGAGKCSLWGFPRSARGLQCSRWQRQ